MIEFIRYCLKDNKDAISFFSDMAIAGHFFDDLVDNDAQITKNEVYENMWRIMVLIPRNRFYVNNFHELNPILSNAILNWKAANEMESTDNENDKEIAFIVRSEYVNLLIHSALIVGGHEWASQLAPEIRRFWHSETFAGYKENLAKQFAKSKENQLCAAQTSPKP